MLVNCSQPIEWLSLVGDQSRDFLLAELSVTIHVPIARRLKAEICKQRNESAKDDQCDG